MSAPTIEQRVKAQASAIVFYQSEYGASWRDCIPDHLFTPEELRAVLNQNTEALKTIERAKVLEAILRGIIECYMSTDQPAELFALIEKAREGLK